MAKLMAKSVLGFGSKQDLVVPCPSPWVRVLQGLCLVPGFKMVVRVSCPLPATSSAAGRDSFVPGWGCVFRRGKSVF